MTRILPAAAALAVLAATGLLHGRMTDRWAASGAVADAVARMRAATPEAVARLPALSA